MRAYTLLIKAFALIGLCGLFYVYGHKKGYEKCAKECGKEENVIFPNQLNYEHIEDLRTEAEY